MFALEALYNGIDLGTALEQLLLGAIESFDLGLILINFLLNSAAQLVVDSAND